MLIYSVCEFSDAAATSSIGELTCYCGIYHTGPTIGSWASVNAYGIQKFQPQLGLANPIVIHSIWDVSDPEPTAGLLTIPTNLQHLGVLRPWS